MELKNMKITLTREERNQIKTKYNITDKELTKYLRQAVMGVWHNLQDDFEQSEEE